MNTNSKKFRLAVLLAGMGAVLLPGVPAYAAGDCADNRVCMWEDSGYSGDRWVNYADGSLSNNRMDIDGWNGDNEISSVKNETGKWVVVWENDDWTNRLFCLGPEADVSDISATFGWGANDDAESFSLHSSKPSVC
ncbi:peptidase inhibitor family I36 protein [Catelliglobosispora koreensis]|uniref:peptidase inhibitor family I36 protein n=1 Tax=Catelliglobosispora koreensis TaxID=129052 RepID=UPI00035DF66A|nr:peptidase inhibitor family I36 protein [Catelliglobosispora koreensis]